MGGNRATSANTVIWTNLQLQANLRLQAQLFSAEWCSLEQTAMTAAFYVPCGLTRSLQIRTATKPSPLGRLRPSTATVFPKHVIFVLCREMSETRNPSDRSASCWFAVKSIHKPPQLDWTLAWPCMPCKPSNKQKRCCCSLTWTCEKSWPLEFVCVRGERVESPCPPNEHDGPVGLSLARSRRPRRRCVGTSGRVPVRSLGRFLAFSEGRGCHLAVGLKSEAYPQ